MKGLFILPTLCLLIFLININIHPCHSQSAKIAIDPGRAQLLKDALGWMTFRKDGKLMTDTELEPLFLSKLYQRYSDSKFYRTFVIAFHQGVLHRLTLQENDACDPDYTLEYKSPHNYSVSWYYQKKFTFYYYDNREYGSTKFCDYRQGLICKYKSGKCGCPEGSEMSEIEPGSSMKRCLLKENEVCALIDIDNGNDPKHSALAENLPQMIFNLEKPLSCKPGMQCRFKNTAGGFSTSIPKCYSSGPWDTGHTPRYGEECSIGLYASPGSCLVPTWSSDEFGWGGKYVCYNFGLPQSKGGIKPGLEYRTGICANEWINYGLSNAYSSHDFVVQINPLFMRHVSPRTIPLRGKDLQKFTKRVLNQRRYFETLEVEGDGESCSTAKTKIMEDIWQYFAGLEAPPPPGQDFVPSATQAELDKHLQLAIDQSQTNSAYCKVYILLKPDYNDERNPDSSFKCVATGAPPDADGNDGECQEPGTLDTLASAEKMGKFLDDTGLAEKDTHNEKDNVRQEILNQNPEAPCIPKEGPNSRSVDALEGGTCPGNSVCVPNYEGSQDIYELGCELKPGVKIRYDCQDISGGDNARGCEKKMLNKKIAEEVERLGTHPKLLGRGDKCRYDWEQEIREGIKSGGEWSGNKYKILGSLIKANRVGNGTICDRTRLLECTDQNVCQCVDKTEPRRWSVEEIDYLSDYCYLKEGSCWTFESVLEHLPLTQSETEAIGKHYGDPTRSSCDKRNTCVFVDYRKDECTTVNTGYTGYDLKPEPTTTTRKSGPSPLAPPNPYRRGGVRGKNELSGMCLMICMVVGLLG